MIYTETDHYVNTLSTIKKEKKKILTSGRWGEAPQRHLSTTVKRTPDKPNQISVKTKAICVSPWYLISNGNVVSDLLFESILERVL